MFKSIAVIGLGLIGGSFAKDVRRLGLSHRIVGFDQSASHRRDALALGLVNEACSTFEGNLSGVQLIMIAVPVREVPAVMGELLPWLPSGVIVTDGCCVKAPMIALMSEVRFKDVRFVGGHPIAGAEQFGPAAAREDLFKGKRFIITTTESTDTEAKETVYKLWQALGSEVQEMAATYHDFVFGEVSHLPHLLAFTTINAIARSAEPDVLKHHGAGLKDFSRIASSSPKMWADIFLDNRDNMLEGIKRFEEVLHELSNMIKAEDREGIQQVLSDAKNLRDKHISQNS